MGVLRLTRGNASTIRAFDSEVELHTPEGLHAVILGDIHLNHTSFLHHVSSTECIVGPICEYSVHTMIDSSAVQCGKMYKLMIPHTLKDVEKVKRHIRVKYGNIHSKVQTLQVIDEGSQNADVIFEVDNKYVIVHTTHFSGFIVTLDGINCCSGSANILLFGSLTNVPEAEPLVTLKVYMSSTHSQIRDYESVS